MTVPAPRRPNVLVVMSDEQSWDTMGCTGNPAARTPALDALCAESTSFDRAYTPFPLCCPSRASLWTGRMPRNHGVLGNWRPVVPELRTAGLAQDFRAAGYHTIYNGKWHVPGTTPQAMGWADASAIPAVINGQDRGRYIPDYRAHAARAGYVFDPDHIENLTAEDLAATRHRPYATSSVELDHYLEPWQTDAFLTALDRRPDDRPWLASCSFNAPHFPLIVPAPYDTLIDRDRIRLPPSLATGPATKPREVRTSRYATDFGHLTEHDWTESVAHYLGLTALVDAQLARIVDHLRRTGQWDNTVVVFTSDHGDLMGAHGLMEKGHLLHYEQALRVPLFVRHPDVPGGTRTDNLVSMCDIGGTLAELAGVPLRDPADGRAFTSMLGTAGAAPTRTHVTAETALAAGHAGGHGEPFHAADWEYPRDSLNLSIRTPEARYIFRSHDEDELYDHADDPHEQHNRAGEPEYRELRRRLRSTLAGEVGDSFRGVGHLLDA